MENENYTNTLVNKSFLNANVLNKYRLYTSRYTTIAIIVCSIIIIAISIINVISLGFSSLSLVSVIFILLAIFYLTNILTINEATFLKMYKSSSLKYDFSFSQDNIKVDVFGQLITSYNICEYQYFTKLIERDECFYLYTNSRNGYVIDKKGFLNGTVEDFKKLMAVSMPPQQIKFQEIKFQEIKFQGF